MRKLGCDAGICITASHNPMEYNGYKVYGHTGDQATDSLAKSIQSQIELVDPFDDVHEISFDTALKSGIVRWIPNSLVESYWGDVLDGLSSVTALILAWSIRLSAERASVMQLKCLTILASTTILLNRSL